MAGQKDTGEVKIRDLLEDAVLPAERDLPLWRFLDHTTYMILRAREKELAQFGLTPEQAVVLDIVHAAGGSTTINRIVEMTWRKHNSISTLVGRMVKQGLVKKSRDRRDRRAFRILATAKGERFWEIMPRDSIRRAFSCLDHTEKDQLRYCLDRLLAHSYELAGAPSPFPPPPPVIARP